MQPGGAHCFQVPDDGATPCRSRCHGGGATIASQPHQIVVDHKSPYLRDKKRPKKTKLQLYVLGSGFVAGWKKLAIATVWGILICFMMDKWIETDYPFIFPISTLPFTIATFILGPMMGLFINYNSTKFVDSMKFYKKAIVKSATLAGTYAAGMRGTHGSLVEDVKFMVTTLSFVMKHQLRKKSTLKSAPLYPSPEVDYNNKKKDDTEFYHLMTPEQSEAIKQQQNELNRWAFERDISGAKRDDRTGNYVMSGIQASRLPWPFALRMEALKYKVCTPNDVVAMLQAKIDNSIPTAGIPPSIINAFAGMQSSLNDIFGDIQHLRNTRVPVVVSNIFYLGIILYLIFLPMAFWDFFRWFTLVPYLLIAFFMLGLLSAVEQLANPFGRFQTSNSIYRDVGRRARVGHRVAWRAFMVALAASTDIDEQKSRKSAATPGKK